MNYTIGDFLIRIKNAYKAYKRDVELPYSKVCLEIGKLLVKEGYLESIKDEKGKITAKLKYNERIPAVNDIKLISKPSVRRYGTKREIGKKRGEYGMYVVTTSNGVMSSRKAQEAGVGGEIICIVS